MRRFLTLLILCLLLPAGALALDLTPYLLPPESEYESTVEVLPLSGNVYVRRSVGPLSRVTGNPEDTVFVTRLRRYENGVCVSDITFPAAEHGEYGVVLRQDGRSGILRAVSYTTPQEAWKHAYTLYDLDGGELANARTFEGEPYMLRDWPGGFAGLCAAGNGQSTLMVYDEDAQPLLRYTVPFENAFFLSHARSGGALYLLLCQNGSPSIPDILMLRVDASAALSWSARFTDEAGRYNMLLPDGQGGVLMTGSLPEDYKQYRVTRIDADGRTCWSKVLSAPKAVLQPLSAEALPDGTVALYGSCVAKSRSLFTLFSITLDAEGRVLASDVRDYSDRADIGPALLTAADGTKLVYSFGIGSEDQPGVLIPFSALPAADNPSITLK